MEDRSFEGEEAVLHVIERIVAPLGLRVDGASPWGDARLPDGSRVLPPSLAAWSPRGSASEASPETSEGHRKGRPSDIGER